ncbi:BZ3501_MvSof-1269-A2-R1_Chr2-2g04398 [Microbotryum saponariae]|nr:BZ3501_MvSof-1269-A2-R1_Chr2-2g04398 [Microbotryum saponariae]
MYIPKSAAEWTLHNNNTVKRFSPIPDMTNVRYEVARSRYRSKFDVAAAFEQVRVIPEHVDRTGFATVTGTYTSCQEHSLHCHQYSKEVSQVCGRSRHQLPVCSLQALSARWCSP